MTLVLDKIIHCARALSGHFQTTHYRTRKDRLDRPRPYYFRPRVFRPRGPLHPEAAHHRPRVTYCLFLDEIITKLYLEYARGGAEGWGGCIDCIGRHYWFECKPCSGGCLIWYLNKYMRCCLHHRTSGGIMCDLDWVYPRRASFSPRYGISSGLVFPDVAEKFVQES